MVVAETLTSVPLKQFIVPAIIFFGIIILGGIAFFIWTMKKGGKKFPFVLYSRDGKTAHVIYGRVKTDPANKSKQSFTFKANSSELLIEPPSLYIDGKPHREVTYGPDGTLVYLTNKVLDDEEYLIKALKPEEKQITLFRMKENNNRYQNPMNKYQALIMGASLILILLLCIGIIYSVISFGKIAKTSIEIAKETNSISASNGQTAQALLKVSEQLTSVTAQLLSGGNVTRQLT